MGINIARERPASDNDSVVASKVFRMGIRVFHMRIT